MDKKKYLPILKVGCRAFRFIALLTLCLFLIPIIMIFEINIYDMEILAVLFTIASIFNLAYYSTINKITCNFIKDIEEKSIDKFQMFGSITVPEAIDIVNIIFNGAMYLSYFICLIIADIPDVTKLLYFLIMIIPTFSIYNTINNYLNNSYKLNQIIREYYDSILNS